LRFFIFTPYFFFYLPFRPNHFVSNPERIILTPLYGLEFERNGRVPGGASAIKDGGDVVASIDARTTRRLTSSMRSAWRKP
jgi:hypothetical protein